MQEAQVAAVQFLESCEDATIVLDLADETLNQVALSVQMLIIFSLFLAVRAGRDYRDRSVGDDTLYEVIRIV